MAYHPESKHGAVQDCTGKAGDDYVGCMKSLLSTEFPGSPDFAPAFRPVQRRVQETIDLIDAASLPETPVAPNRWVLAGAGLFVGLFLGAYGLRNPQRAVI